MPDFENGQVVGGRYTIQRCLGHGGFGTVYKAHDDKLNRPVAVKVLRGLMATVLDRHLDEARKLVQLGHHPSLVSVYDVFDETNDWPQPAIVMEYVNGCALDEELKRLRKAGHWIPLADALMILNSALDGLAISHRAGLVHRDVKPQNILVDRTGPRVQAKLVDFGIALPIEEARSAGDRACTPFYASPEQLTDKAAVDFRSDIFSLGLVAYLMLTGAHPFRDPAGLFQETELIRESLHSHVPTCDVNKAIPPEISRIVDRMLDKDINARYPDAECVKQELDAILSNPRVCQICQTRMPEAARFCPQCGTACGGQITGPYPVEAGPSLPRIDVSPCRK